MQNVVDFMITTKRHRHTHGVLPLKAPPWIHNHHHQYVLSLLLIICTIFLHQQTSSSFTTRFFNSIHNSPPLLSPPLLSPPLLFDLTLFSTDLNNKNHKTIHPPPTNILHPITSSHRPPPPPLPTTTLPSSGTHVHIPPTPLSTHTLYQFPRIFENILLRLDAGIHHIRIILLQLNPGIENILLQLDRTHVPSTSFTTPTRTQNLTKTNTSHVPSTSATPNTSHVESPQTHLTKKFFLCTQGIHHHTHTRAHTTTPPPEEHHTNKPIFSSPLLSFPP